MPIFPCEKSEVTYCITVGVDFMLAIMDRDWTDNPVPLVDLLEVLTDCHEIEYDGHLGPFVYVSVIKKYDTAFHMQKVMKIIDDYVRGKEFKDEEIL